MDTGINDLVEKYSKSMNLKEISEIEDIKIRDIKRKYHTLQHEAFINEKKYSDKEWIEEFDRLHEQEKLEIEKYLTIKE